MSNNPDTLAGLPAPVRQLVHDLADLPSVAALALAGSRADQLDDAESDYDLYVYTREEIDPAVRRVIATNLAASGQRLEIDNRFWEPGDEWLFETEGQLREVDIMYRDPQWITGELDRVLTRHEASLGYTTCLWYNILHSQPLYDPTGWYAALQQQAAQPYPKALRRAILAKNYPLLRSNHSSYSDQIKKALARQDLISVNHRLAALLASYFDILFALNLQPHPGEKRLLAQARRLCPHLPANFEENLTALLTLPPTPANATAFTGALGELLQNLDDLMRQFA